MQLVKIGMGSRPSHVRFILRLLGCLFPIKDPPFSAPFSRRGRVYRGIYILIHLNRSAIFIPISVNGCKLRTNRNIFKIHNFRKNWKWKTFSQNFRIASSKGKNVFHSSLIDIWKFLLREETWKSLFQERLSKKLKCCDFRKCTCRKTNYLRVPKNLVSGFSTIPEELIRSWGANPVNQYLHPTIPFHSPFWIIRSSMVCGGVCSCPCSRRLK